MTIAFVFPGQGSQAVGMGAELAKAYASARAVFDEVDAALGQKLSDIMFKGPIETLTLTENAQPALMAVSLAVMRVLEHEKGFRLAGKVKYVAGHSLGEYSALAAAGALSVADAARLLKTRGRAMQAAVPVGQGAMAALLGVGKEAAEKLAAEAAQGEVCQLANDNEPTQAVISGAKTAIDRAAGLAKAHGVRRFMPLNVSAPFHCALMQPAADVMADALAKVEIKAPAVPLVANVLAAPISDPAEIRRRLVEQVTGTVRWRECVARMAADGVTDHLRDRLGQGAGRARQAHRAGAQRNLDRHAAGYRGRAAVAHAIGVLHVRAQRQDRARHRRDRRHRRRHRPRAAQAGGDRRHLRPPDRQAREARRRARLARARLPCDLGNKAQVAKLIDEAMAKLGGRLDILVNNAGLTKDNLFMVMKDEQWDEVIAVNLTSTFMLMRAGARAMMRAKTGYGRIVNISSISGIIGNPGQGNYSASKAGIIAMSKSLAREVASRGITVNCIAPGFISTPMTDALNEKQTSGIKEHIPAQKFGTPDDIAAATVYLASAEAAYMTGQTLHVNGGLVMI